MDKTLDALTALLTGLFLLVIAGFLLGGLVMLLWNYCLIPATSGLHEINWLQGWGLMLLFGLLFKSNSYKKG